MHHQKVKYFSAKELNITNLYRLEGELDVTDSLNPLSLKQIDCVKKTL